MCQLAEPIAEHAAREGENTKQQYSKGHGSHSTRGKASLQGILLKW